jgi:hypothetical protein
LQDQESHGFCELWYFDVSGFCLTPYIPYAWQPIGSTIAIPTSTHRRRLNVLGFLNRNNELYPYIMEGKVDTPVIVECFDQFSKQLSKRTYVLLDNSVAYLSAADNYFAPKPGTMPPTQSVLEGARPWSHTCFTTNSLC